MTKTNKLILGAVVLGVLLSPVKNASAVSSLGCLNLSQNMRYGSQDMGGEVLTLQKFLNEKGYLGVEPTGFFGRLTDSAVKKFQKENSLPAFGYVGPITRKLVTDITCAVPQSNEVSVVSNETNVASAIISIPTPTPTPSNILKLPFKTESFSDWQRNWGNVVMSTQGIEVKATTTLTDAQVTFPKSMSLGNYIYRANVFVKQGTVILIARYVDDKNFLGCAFSGKNIDIIQWVDGEQETVATTYVDDSAYQLFFYNDLNLAMTLKNKTVGCRMIGNSDNITYKNVNDALLSGGVGVQIWHEGEGVADVVVKSIALEEN